MGKTVIVGSVPKAYRYAHQAAVMLEERDFDFIPLGIPEGEVLGREILNVNTDLKLMTWKRSHYISIQPGKKTGTTT